VSSEKFIIDTLMKIVPEVDDSLFVRECMGSRYNRKLVHTTPTHFALGMGRSLPRRTA
jgi:hypothetical protein